ncbi:pyrroline-5-carboxylate reductase-like [Coccinella septempunctata]|uniref:pyrroline-5-carboxylate reductase-like n=1 Tax=Coccinella septempunctata TaxID=41139 RepID=UPI001D0782D9|nr:pyrroline-5-carboxylate reductase-like [Coccinella septempunctata]
MFSPFYFSRNFRNNFRIIMKYASNYSTQQNQRKLKEKIGFIGDGNMAKAICFSMVKQNIVDFSQIYVSSPYKANLNIWEQKGAHISTRNADVAKEADVIFLCVKPHFLQAALDDITEVDKRAHEVRNKLFISILAGYTVKDLEVFLRPFENCRIIRVMPNTPVLIGEGCTVYCPGEKATKTDIDLVRIMMESTGLCFEVEERFIDPIAAVCASGPAYVYLFIEALSDGGVRMGLHREMATKLAAQTVLGASKMVMSTEKHMGTLKDEVCSAGGTTIAGIHALEKGGVRGSVMNAVEAATKRAKELRKIEEGSEK